MTSAGAFGLPGVVTRMFSNYSRARTAVRDRHDRHRRSARGDRLSQLDRCATSASPTASAYLTIAAQESRRRLRVRTGRGISVADWSA
jgi:hypothetical protein